jgi:hypothetical protein
VSVTKSFPSGLPATVVSRIVECCQLADVSSSFLPAPMNPLFPENG